MNKTNIIQMADHRPVCHFPEEETKHNHRQSGLLQNAARIIEVAATVGIAVCMCICMLLFFTML